MKIALAGIGKIALDQHIPAIAASPEWELAATVSRNGRVDGVEAFADMGAMLAARPDIPVVSLCTPPVPRFAQAEAALAAGRHVMLEKPPGATLSECHRLERLARAKGLTLFATWHSREAAAVEPARAWLADKRLRRLRVTWHEDVRKWHPGQDWVFEPGGLGVFDPGVNALSIVTRILPAPIHVAAARLLVPQNRHTPIAADLTFSHPDGAAATASFDWRETPHEIWQIEAETDAGTLHLNGGGAEMRIDGASVPTDAAPDAPAGEYPKLYAAMTRLVAARTIDMDIGPLRHVADAFLRGKWETAAPFHF